MAKSKNQQIYEGFEAIDEFSTRIICLASDAGNLVAEGNNARLIGDILDAIAAFGNAIAEKNETLESMFFDEDGNSKFLTN